MLPLILLSLACTPDLVLHPGQLPSTGDTAADTGLEELEVLTAQARANTMAGGVAEVQWKAGTPGRSWVEYGLDGELEHATPVEEEERDLHKVSVVGLKLGRTYEWRACTLTDDGVLLTSPVATLEVPPPPPEMVPVHLTISEPGAHQGYAITSLIHKGRTWVVIIDSDGDLVWTWSGAIDSTIPMVRPSMRGGTLVYSQHGQDHTVDRGEVVEVRLDGTAEPLPTQTHNGHHAFVQLDNGRFARLSLRQEEIQLQDGPHLVSGDRIIEVLPGCEDRSRYDVVFDFFEGYDRQPGEEVLELNDMAGGADWTHSNSLAFLPRESGDTWGQPMGGAGDYFLGARNLDAMFRIRRGNGQIRWQMGGKGSDFDFPKDDAWHEGHFSEVWEGGFLIMDNRNPIKGSRVVEYAWDEEARTVEAVWEYPHPDGGYVSFLGDARRMPDDHVLVSWTSLGTLEEVDRQGHILWQVQADLGAALGRVWWVPELSELLEERE